MTQSEPARPNVGECVAPVLPMRDADATAAFYGKLGFDRVRRYGEPVCDYLIVASGWMELHFFRHPACDPLTSIAGAFVRVADVDAVTSGFSTHVASDPRGTPRFLSPVTKPWGMRQAVLVDPDGNLVQFGTPLSDTQPAS